MECSFCSYPVTDPAIVRITASLEQAFSYLKPPLNRIFLMCPACLRAIKLTTPNEFSTTITGALCSLIQLNTPKPHHPEGDPKP